MPDDPRDVLVTYRELAPAPALRNHVRAFFSFVPGGEAWRGRRAVTREVRFMRGDSFCSPQFADGHGSLVVDLGAKCALGTGWTTGTQARARLIGALQRVGPSEGDERPAMVGAYFEPGAAAVLSRTPAAALTDRVVDLELLWGSSPARMMEEELSLLDEHLRVDRLEAALLARAQPVGGPGSSVDAVRLARWVWANPTTMTVKRLADAAGASRQHLARVFGDVIGVSPKRYCRIARFHAGLAYVGAGASVRWADVAAGLGYADQSHMIAEFRELSALTPEALANGRWFHPFILDARARLQGPEAMRVF